MVRIVLLIVPMADGRIVHPPLFGLAIPALLTFVAPGRDGTAL
jgi:hypothetical protein